jgi:hypothetical protein
LKEIKICSFAGRIKENNNYQRNKISPLITAFKHEGNAIKLFSPSSNPFRLNSAKLILVANYFFSEIGLIHLVESGGSNYI